MRSNRLRYVIPTLLVVALTILSFMSFIRGNSQRIERQNEEYIAELTAQRAISVNNLLEENESFIQATAYLYGTSLDSPDADVDAISSYEESSSFDHLRFVDASGDDYTSDGMRANLSDRAYFQAGMRGESGITYVTQSRVTGEHQIGFYAPVSYHGEVIGVMVGFYGEDFIRTMLEFELFGEEGEGWLCDADGTVIGSTLAETPENYLDFLEESGRCGGQGAERVREAFATGSDITFDCHFDGGVASASAVALERGGWMLVRCFPPSASAQILENANGEGIRLIATLVALFAAYTLYLAISFLLDRRRSKEANRIANDISRGVSTMFDVFVELDLDRLSYEYVGGTPNYGGIPARGDIDTLRQAVTSYIPDEGERQAAFEAFGPEALRRALADTDRISMRVHAPSTLGEWQTFNFAVIERVDGMPTRLLVATQDTTELQRKEQEEQRRLQEALDAAEKASHAKTEFLFNMSHDIRTPMNAIIGYTELAEGEGTTPEQMRDYIHKIDSSSRHLLALINDILEMSRIESGKMTLDPEPCDIARVVDEARTLFTSQMQAKGIDFMADTSSSVTDRWVLCDKNRLNRVLLNLLSNAYKFTPEGGSVAVELVQEGSADGVASFALHVRDTGIGMSPEFAGRLFSPFERERTSTVSGIQGTGLGLSITKSIVDLMGGTIEVATEQGAGTEFVVRTSFPIVEPPEQQAQDEPREVVPANFEGMRLLLVEDNPVNREIATLILSSFGFELEHAENGQVALDKVATSEPGHYDAVLMDIQMPVMDGYAATRAIRALDDEILANVPIVAMTANAFAEDIQAAHSAGMDGHIAKPLEIDKMTATLSEVLHYRRHR